MKIYDISQELFSCKVFPGDPVPGYEQIMSIENGDSCNLTKVSMCAHNGTHIDAPFHFIKEGKRIDEIELSCWIGPCFVTEQSGDIGRKEALLILENAAKEGGKEAAQRILIKGKAVVTLGAAKTFAEAGVVLLGNESQTVGPEDSPAEVHLALLGRGVVLLEGIRLAKVSQGSYLLNAAPINFGGLDGAPCRAVLIDGIKVLD